MALLIVRQRWRRSRWWNFHCGGTQQLTTREAQGIYRKVNAEGSV